MSRLTVIAKGTNARGDIFAACHCVNHWGEDSGYGVWRLCENYQGGRIFKTWRYVEIGMTRDAALALLERRTARKIKQESQ
ncbi:hypothetical protein [Paraburkholderia largidicola]|uniref:Uncharacterized protein n=1 Tax=Paraburkholderia largidicola TaxID=3014751 RepID=A0A7I8C4L4_9BURK|nr:hypothetical protein [Paraburkholderia sp. PGU16]BCF95401.1 hypothetical protein PPGU16_84680 [Paraburkholderia sp. PGU16]